MKVLFICSSLEPGRDGVGDYTRRLASELIRQGHSSSALSLNDKYIADTFNDIQQSEGINLPVMRLPSAWAMKARLRQAKKYIDDFDPDWLSLQFVIFGFHPKGLPLGLGRQLALLGFGRRWHIMFHELWLGMEIGSSKKHLLWGTVQELLIKSLISALKPEVIHTNTILYQRHLAVLGFVAQHLPLFSNIPKVENNDERLNLNQSFEMNKSINLILFGNIHPNAPIEDFTNDVAAYADKTGVDIRLTIIGRCGPEQERWAHKWVTAGMTVNMLGEQPVNNISTMLTISSMGISTTPLALIGKSGSVAAMQEHGLPVICVQFPWQPKDFVDLKISPGIIAYKKGNIESIFTGRVNLPVNNNVSVVTYQFVERLNNA